MSPSPETSAAPVSLRGRVIRITFQNPDNGFTVAKVQAEGKPGLLPVVGLLPGLTEGQEVELTGREIIHPKFGAQFEAQGFTARAPRDSEGIKRYLASGLIKGVGPRLAERISDHLGADALTIILEHPERLAQVPGIGRKKGQAIAQAVAAHGQLREVMVFLQSHGVGASLALKVWRQYGAGALGVLRQEPHRLAADVRGIGFATADQIAARLGIAADHPARVEAGLIHTLRQAEEEGHVFLPYEELMIQATALLRLERGLLGPAFARLHHDRKIILDESGGEKAVYRAPLFYLERRCGQALSTLASRPGILPAARAERAVAWAAGQLGQHPSPGQARALTTILQGGLAVLTGGPGTGKTTLVRLVLAICRRLGLRVALAAPTGRAAKRLEESSGQAALTLHRLLEYQPKDNRFARNPERPLGHDLVVVDESSMIDLWLMTHLAEALGEHSRLLLVGDADQLPSVGPGMVLRQLMSSPRVALAQLTEIFRQDSAGLLVKNAHRVLHGQMPLVPSGRGTGADFYFLEEPDSGRAAELVAGLVCERLPARFGFDPAREIQVLAPMHRGHLGTGHLNQLLRARLNPAAGVAPGFAAGDKVMQVRNNYDLEAFNGDLGRVATVDEEGCQVALGERLVRYAPADLDDLVWGYAITIHKSQGSEYPAVVVALAMEHFIMLNRQLLYTAITRARRLVLLVGQGAAVRKAVETAEANQRHARWN